MKKYNVVVDGKHNAEVHLNADGKGGFTGEVLHTELGDGTITNGVETGSSYKGNVNLNGHNCAFVASVSGDSVSGSISTHIIFLGTIVKSFTGTVAA